MLIVAKFYMFTTINFDRFVFVLFYPYLLWDENPTELLTRCYGLCRDISHVNTQRDGAQRPVTSQKKI